jgi:hypothetical protein
MLLRSVDQRLEKLRRYESIEEGSSWKYAYHYLPELFPKVDQRPALLNTTEFDNLLDALPRPEASPHALTRAERRLILVATGQFQRQIRKQWQPSSRRRPRILITLLANRTVAEFVCTIAKAVGFVERGLPPRMRVSGWLHELGSDLYNKSLARRSG